VVAAVPGLAVLKTWSTALVGWEETMQRGIENEFARLETFFNKKEDIHNAQANVDLALFLKRYLAVDTNGRFLGAKAKPSTAVVLHRFRLENQNLPNEIASRTPGLHLHVFEGFAVIGWDASTVNAEIELLKQEETRKQLEKEAEIRAEQEKERLAKKARRDRRYKGYHELVAQQQQRPSPLGLQHLPGSYVVEIHSERHDDEYKDLDHNDPLTRINVFPAKSSHGVTAMFSFDGIEGTMLLAMSRRGVELLREEQPKHCPYSDAEDSGEDFDGPSISRARRSGVVKDILVGEKRSVGQMADPWGVQAARANRQKVASSGQQEHHPNRVYFQFACNEIEGYPVVDQHNEYIGYLDFDDTGLAAKGVFSYPPQGIKNEAISICKIAEKPLVARGTEPMPWYEFDGRRWGGWWSKG
jgi:hypothetical protein